MSSNRRMIIGRGRKVLAVVLLITIPVALLLVLTGVVVGAGDRLPRWSDLLFLLALLGSGAYLHELFAHWGEKRTSGFWKGLSVASLVFVLSVVWVVWDSLVISGG